MPNKVFKGPQQMEVEVILASRPANSNEPPLFTVRMRYPRIIHGEIMTHRDFSRNARSSRAVPFKTMLAELLSTAFIPWHWGKNQKGMQAFEECNELVVPTHWIGDGGMTREEAWLHARDSAVEIAQAFDEAEYHKQIVNRLIEPFSWIDVLITSNRWANFLWLRDHKDAEPHLQDLARLVGQALAEAEIQTLEPGEWHLPYITKADVDLLIVESGRLAGERYEALTGTDKVQEWLLRLSAARCARISYKPFDGDASYEREFERYNSLVKSDRVHASPLEHQATPDSRKTKADINGPAIEEWETDEWRHPELHGNLPGWIQSRKLVPNEAMRNEPIYE